MKRKSFIKRILTCALAATAIVTAGTAYTYAAELEDEIIVAEEESAVLTENSVESTDSYDVILDDNNSENDEEKSEPTYAHKLTLSSASDYNSVVIGGKNVNKGESVGFNDGDRIVITGLGKSDTIDTKNWSTYINKWTIKGDKEYGYEYSDGYMHDGGLFALSPTEDVELTVEGRRIPTSAITAKGKLDGAYKVVPTVAAKKGNYINIPSHKADTKVTFAVKKTGSLNYEFASDAAAIQFGSGNPEPISLTEEKNSYCYKIPFMDLAQLAYSDNASIEFTTAVAAKLTAPTGKVASSTDIDATLSLAVPKAMKDLPKLWYRIVAKANVPKNKTLPEGMAESVGPLYVPASVTSLPVYLMAEEGKELGAGAAQKYDFTVSILQLENEPEYSDKPLTDKTTVEGEGGANVVGVSPEKKINGTTKKPAYEEKLGLNKKQANFIRGEGISDGILLATAKYSNSTTFRSLAYAEITNATGDIVKSSDNEDASKKIYLDGDSIILGNTSDLLPGKYKLNVRPVSKEGSPLPKAATLALTVKQGIDEITFTMDKLSYVKKDKKALNINAPKVTYNGGEKTKTPAVKKLKWELLDANGDEIKADSPLYDTVKINEKNGKVTVAKELAISGDPSAYRFKIMATADDYAGNTTSAKTDVIELTTEENKPKTLSVELLISIDEISGQGRVKESDIEFFGGVEKKNGKYYVTGEDILFKIANEGTSDVWGASLYTKADKVSSPVEYKNGCACFSSGVVSEKMKKAKQIYLGIYFK